MGPPTTTRPLPFDSPFVGREHERRLLDQAFDEAATSRRVVCIVGEAGIGKTHLARSLAAHATTHRRHVLWGNATPHDEGLPLGIFQDLLRNAQRSDVPPVRDPLAASFPSRVLPELEDLPAGQATGRSVLFEAAARWFREIAGTRGLLVVLEDLHWADTTSLDLVTALSRTLEGTPALILVTFRPPDQATPHGLANLRRELARSSPGSERPLGPLHPEEIVRIVEAIAGPGGTATRSEVIAHLSGGNPFIAQELALSRSPGLEANDGVQITWSLHDLVDARVGDLDPAAREVLAWAAMLGERFDVDVLRQVVGLELAAFRSALVTLATAGLIADMDVHATVGTGMTFRHALTQVAIASRMLVDEQRTRHAAILAVATRGIGNLPLEELLSHARGANDRAQTLHLTVRAARRAVEHGALDDADRQYAAARELISFSDDERGRAEILAESGSLVGVLRPGAEAVEYLHAAAMVFTAIGDLPAAVTVRVQANVLRWRSGDPSGVADVIALVETLVDADPAALTRALSGAANILILSGGDPGLATSFATRGLDLAATLPTPVATVERLRCLNVLGMVALQHGDFARGRATMLECAQLGVEVGHPAGQVFALGNLATIGQWDAAPTLRELEQVCDDALAMAGARGMRGQEAWLALTRASLALRTGATNLVDPLVTHAALALLDGPDPSYERQMVIVQSQHALQLGLFEQARDGFVSAVADAQAMLDDGERDARIGLAHAFLALGDPERALEVVVPWVSLVRENPSQLRTYGSLLVAGIEAATLVGDPCATEWADLLRTHAPGPRSVIVDALCSIGSGAVPDEEGVLAAFGTLVASGRVWEAARAQEMLAERHGCPSALSQRCATDARAAFLAMGADGWARRAERLLRGFGQPVATRRTAMQAAGLTGREMEVLALVADGHANAAIAARLHLGLSTIETHLRNIFRKLGARRRTEAVRVARDRGLLDPPAP